MNHRYTQIIVTCLIVGTLTFALRQNHQHSPCCACGLKEKTILTADTSTPEATDKQPKIDAHSIVVEPDISSKNLSVKHGFFSYSPTSISLTINDEEIEVNNYDPITLKVDANNLVTTCCKYKFIAGYEGEITATWKVKPGTTYTLNFDWKTPEKILIDGAELVSTIKNSKSGDGNVDEKEAEDTSSKTTQSSDVKNATKEEEQGEENEEEENKPVASKKSAGIPAQPEKSSTKKTLPFLK